MVVRSGKKELHAGHPTMHIKSRLSAGKELLSSAILKALASRHNASQKEDTPRYNIAVIFQRKRGSYWAPQCRGSPSPWAAVH